jgi:hypothetical protein
VSCPARLRSPSAPTPVSRATAVTVVPDERTNATASRLNSPEFRLPRLFPLLARHFLLRNLMSRSPGAGVRGRPTGR